MASSSNSSDAKAARRGPTVMKAVIRARSKGQKFDVEWNSLDQPIRANGKILKSYIGAVVRQTVPIICSNWKDEALDGFKESIWADVQMSFNVDESRKKFILQEAGNLHRAFRTRLTKQFLRDANGNINEEPPSQYPHISRDEWTDFIAIRTGDAQFLKLSNENRNRALDPACPYKASRKGYADIEDELIQEAGPEVKKIKRHIVWRKARENKAGVIDNKNTQTVWNKCEELSQSAVEGEIQDFGRQDILAKAIGVPENPGRVRGVGFGVSQKDYFPPEGRARNNSETKKWETLVSQLSDRLNILEEKLKQKDDEERQANFTAQASVKDSCTLPSASRLPEGVNSCQLYLSTPNYRMVAMGKVYNEPGVTLHTGPVPLNHVKVGVDVATEGDAPLPVPIVDADVMTVGDAIGTYVAWPIDLVVVINMAPAKAKGKGRVSGYTKESITTPENKGGNSEANPPTAGSTTTSLEYLNFLKIHERKNMKNADQLYVEMEQNIFGNHFIEMLNTKNIREVVNHEWVSASVISAYIRYLYEELLLPKEITRRFLFLSPHQTNTYGYFGRDSQTTYLADRFATKEREYQPLFLAPCNVGNHWVLCAINIVEEIIYYLDPLYVDPRDRPELKNLFDTGLQVYRANIGAKVPRLKATNIKWIQIQCPRQPNSTDCGYYVMRFMKETILQNQVKIPMAYFPDFKCSTYSTAQLSEVKE